ncbi:hypothetical protein AYI70_g1616 [Smittium culicis]|uniref:Uncharacterized protein n=1 Tax=Smittium culicis TaxID=133412 RepID=A0A1R1YBV1_9FUNG|nr:hypothetical protein AYI70_g1616 [Smittium culicis]
MNINCQIDRTSDSEPVIMGAQAEVLERKIVPTRDLRVGNLYRFQLNCLWDSCELSILLSFVESLRGVDVHQLQRVIFDFIRVSTTERCCSFGIVCLRQYHNPSVHKEVFSNHLSEIARVFRKYLESLSEDENSPSGYICTFYIGTIRDTQCRPVRIVDEQESGALLQLVPRKQVNWAECPNLQLVTLEKPILLPSMELDIPGCTESFHRTSNINLSSPVIENGNMVLGSPEIISLPTAITTGNHRNTRPKKRKIIDIEKQELVSYGVENQQSFLKTHGLSDSASNIIFSKERSV